MKKYLTFLMLMAPLFLMAYVNDPVFFLQDRLPPLNGRYKTFTEALKLMGERHVQTIVEAGTERWYDGKCSFDGDGGATIIFAHWAQENNAMMFSVDISEKHLEYSAHNTQQYISHLSLVHSDSVAFLQNFPSTIDFLYLDSYDYDANNPLPAQEHCLAETRAAENKLTSRSIVMIDDCNVPGGGKGLLAIQYLLSKGWFLHKNHHQVILLKER